MRCGAARGAVGALQRPNNYVLVAERLAAELERTAPEGVLYANQWDNLANREGHVRSTDPEIRRQTDGHIDGFICAIGTGGTLAAVGLYLKSRKSDVVIAAADPMGAGMARSASHANWAPAIPS